MAISISKSISLAIDFNNHSLNEIKMFLRILLRYVKMEEEMLKFLDFLQHLLYSYLPATYSILQDVKNLTS